ncbi:hypothetical protein Hanom_Chr16g01476981 [Helianthus anomalus]
MVYIIGFFILYVESYLFSKHNIFFIFFSLCALFLKKKPTLFLRLAPRLRARREAYAPRLCLASSTT